MKEQLLILIIISVFASCNQTKKENKAIDKPSTVIENNVIERHFPNEKETLEFDTIISSKDLQILITSNYLDSYVTNEFISEGVKYIDRYRDSKKRLIIKKSNELLIDTIFEKDNFSNFVELDFLKVASFNKYSFDGIENETIELFGVISKPETDWAFVFYHYYDLKTNTIRIEEIENN